MSKVDVQTGFEEITETNSAIHKACEIAFQSLSAHGNGGKGDLSAFWFTQSETLSKIFSVWFENITKLVGGIPDNVSWRTLYTEDTGSHIALQVCNYVNFAETGCFTATSVTPDSRLKMYGQGKAITSLPNIDLNEFIHASVISFSRVSGRQIEIESNGIGRNPRAVLQKSRLNPGQIGDTFDLMDRIIIPK